MIGTICFLLGVVGSSFLLGALESCVHGKPEETVTEVPNGSFKVMVRSQEFHHSGTRNIDACVANASDRTFPTSKAQCFFHGYDFSGLSATWDESRVIRVSFGSGRLSQFTNSAFVNSGGPIPEEFRIVLFEGCEAGSK
jgi:hypothetical protein